MNADFLKKEFIEKYKTLGYEKFYKFLLVYSVKRLIILEKKELIVPPPHLELLDICNQFIILYRREGDKDFLEVSKIFRKVAHKIYRIMLKKNLTNKCEKFLNLV